MLEQPKKSEKRSGPEVIEKMTVEFLSKEIEELPDTKRAGGFLLTTFLAMGLAVAGAGKAEAQVMGGVSAEIYQNGRIAASQVLDRHRMKAEIKINQEFQQKLQEIDRQKSQLGQEFKNGNMSQQEYQIRMQQLDQAVFSLSHQKDRKVANPLGVKGRVLQGIIRGY